MREEIKVQATLTFDCDADQPLADQLADINMALQCASEWLSEVKQGTYLTAFGVTKSATEAQTYRDVWAEDPDYPVSDWKYQIENNDTRRGYWDWVEAQRE